METDGRTCTQCKTWKQSHEFSWKGHDHKRLASRCHSCRRANYKENPDRARERSREYNIKNRDIILKKMRTKRVEDVAGRLVYEARKRAKVKGLPFDLTKSDIHVPTNCPVLGMLLVVNSGKCGPDSPTLDRIHPELGYVKGNVLVISHRANTVKNDATIAEIEAVLRYYKSNAQRLI